MSTFSKSLDLQETVFAELCLDTSEIVLDSPHIIDIISGKAEEWDPLDTNYTVKMTEANFVRLFYGVNQSTTAPQPSFDTAFQLTGSGPAAIEYYRLNKPYEEQDSSGCSDAEDEQVYSIMGNDGEPLSSGDDSTGETLNLIDPIVDYWVRDTGHCADSWSTCSYMSIAKEIDASHHLQNLDCNICCSLEFGELLGLLDAKQPFRNATTSVNEKRTTVIDGDKVGLRILYKNAFEGCKNVEVRIHFEICV